MNPSARRKQGGDERQRESSSPRHSADDGSDSAIQPPKVPPRRSSPTATARESHVAVVGASSRATRTKKNRDSNGAPRRQQGSDSTQSSGATRQTGNVTTRRKQRKTPAAGGVSANHGNDGNTMLEEGNTARGGTNHEQAEAIAFSAPSRDPGFFTEQETTYESLETGIRGGTDETSTPRPGAYRIDGINTNRTRNDEDDTLIVGDGHLGVQPASTPENIVQAELVVPQENIEATDAVPLPDNVVLVDAAQIEALERKQRRSRRLLRLLVAVLIVTGVVLVVVFTTRSGGSDETKSPTLSPSSSPSASPTLTQQPTIPFLEESIKTLIISRTNDPATFDDASSPESKALEWLLSDPFATSSELSDDEIVQRFTFATLWYATNGPNWKQDEAWLESVNECSWDESDEPGSQVVCNGNGAGDVQELNLAGNNLLGIMPNELSLLTELTLLDLSDNRLSGRIPYQLGFLTNLEVLRLSNNSLMGGIPSQILLLVELKELSLSNNQLSGTIEAELCLRSISIDVDCDEVFCSCCGC